MKRETDAVHRDFACDVQGTERLRRALDEARTENEMLRSLLVGAVSALCGTLLAFVVDVLPWWTRH